MLADRFPGNLKLVTATLDGSMLAGAVVYETAMVTRTQYLGATSRGRAVNALSSIIDQLIDDAAGTTAYLDFGTSMLDGGPELNAGVLQYKESFGARAVAYDEYELDV
jgi:hypothetical protein